MSYGYGYGYVFGFSLVPGWIRGLVGSSSSSYHLQRWELQQGGVVVVIIVHNIRSGGRGHLRHPVLALAEAIQQNQICLNCRTSVMKGTRLPPHLLKLLLDLGAPGVIGLWLLPNGDGASWEIPDMVVMAARPITSSEDGGRPCPQFSSYGFFTAVNTTESFVNNAHSCCPQGKQVATFQCCVQLHHSGGTLVGKCPERQQWRWRQTVAIRWGQHLSLCSGEWWLRRRHVSYGLYQAWDFKIFDPIFCLYNQALILPFFRSHFVVFSLFCHTWPCFCHSAEFWILNVAYHFFVALLLFFTYRPFKKIIVSVLSVLHPAYPLVWLEKLCFHSNWGWISKVIWPLQRQQSQPSLPCHFLGGCTGRGWVGFSLLLSDSPIIEDRIMSCTLFPWPLQIALLSIFPGSRQSLLFSLIYFTLQSNLQGQVLFPINCFLTLLLINGSPHLSEQTNISYNLILTQNQTN